MGEVKWNKGQREVLDSIKEDSNLLVSAAAGSGKTAVLVERIIRSVEAGLCEMDQILVMTFTRAAAAQMKGKIIEKLEERAYESGNPLLLAQLTKAANADISTIDSFCNRVVKENFQIAGIDPGYATMDSGESDLLKEEILDRILDQLYRDPDFRRIASFYTTNVYDDSHLRELIKSVDQKAESFADPEGWLASAAPSPEGDPCKMEWAVALLKDRKRQLADHLPGYEALKEPFMGEQDPDKVKTAGAVILVLDHDITRLKNALLAEDIFSFTAALKEKKQSFLKGTYIKHYPEELIEQVSKLRSALNKKTDALAVTVDREGLEAELEDAYAMVSQLVRAVLLFRQEMAVEKKRLKKYDFGDIAHAAYHILYDTVKKEVTPVGQAYSERYRYIYVDEYQDGTDMQEHIMNSVARYRDGHPYNIFMVGDVKQSIYRFRQAKPELFQGKEKAYREKTLPGRVIYLNQNYRSFYEILEACNFFFRRLMREDFGGILYNEEVQLNPPDGTVKEIREDRKAELLLGDLTEPEDAGEEEELQDPEKAEASADPAGKAEADDTDGGDSPDDQRRRPESKDILEARMIGHRIRSLIYGDPETGEGPLYIANEAFDRNREEGPENPKRRPLEFRDITILQRSVRNCGGMIREYERMGIPVQLDDPKAYFDAEEVVTILSTLNVIDNARQDIPYAAVLHSPFGGFTDEDLVRLTMQRAYYRENLYDTAERVMNGEDASLEAIREKLIRINGMIRDWKKAAVYLSISQLIDRILTDTDYRFYAAGLPRGERRLSNLMQLTAKAEDFEQAGNHGLFTFLRYIAKCRIHEADFARGTAFTEMGNSVRVCTMHSSKGLEYPVVFLACLGRNYYRADSNSPVMLSARYGIVPSHIRRVGKRYIQSTKGILRNTVEKLEWTESLQEELRLLYVGMTRAKERLIMTGMGRDLREMLEEAAAGEPDRTPIPYTELGNGQSNLDYILKVIGKDIHEAEKYLKIRVIDPCLLSKEEVKTGLPAEQKEVADAASLAEELKEAYNFTYPYLTAVETRTKLSVSEIKHEAMEARGLGIEEPAPGQAAEPESAGTEGAGAKAAEAESAGAKNAEPAGTGTKAAEAEGGDRIQEEKRTKKKTLSGADYGTAVHKLMELLPFREINSRKDLVDWLKKMLRSGAFTPEHRRAIRAEKLAGFYSADEHSLFARMKKADEQGMLYKEQQFLMELPAKRLGAEIPLAEAGEASVEEDGLAAPASIARSSRSGAGTEPVTELCLDTDEPVVLQGIIDAFFLETDEDGKRYAVLMDYKTDRMNSAGALIDRYSAQLSLYKETVEDILQLPVRETWLYGFSEGLGEIRIPE